MAGIERVWEARTGTAPAEQMLAYSESTEDDAALIEADLAGSVAHALGLLQAGLLTAQEARALVGGLQLLAEKAQDGELALDPQLEDVHMNVEHALEALVGDPAGKLHAGRSRNDQVALDLLLVARQGLVTTAGAAHQLASTLCDLATEHATTPWTLHTHGLPAQPSTLGHLFHAHALGFARDVERALETFDAHDTSPLGSAAGAGSTLDLDPGYTADLLGLEAPGNALRATGSRDASLETTQVLATLGHHATALAIDLVDLAEQGALELPSAYTTGSSIMPHKRNPDALELARADGARLGALHDELARIAGGLGLGYHRDLQRAKPPLLEAVTLAPQLLGILDAVLDGATVDTDVLAEQQARPSIATTDAAEALVEAGVPFRTAHRVLSEASAAAQDGEPIGEALAQADLPEDALAAVQVALNPDPARRDTPGGPAPDRVTEASHALAVQLDQLADAVTVARAAAEQPFDLLDTPPEQLVPPNEEVAA